MTARALTDGMMAAIAEGRPMSRAQSSLLRSMLSSVWSMTREGTSAGDLKIADAAVIYATRVLGLSLNEVADLTGVPAGHLRRRRRYAVERLVA